MNINSKVYYENKLVAYADILGFKDMLKYGLKRANYIDKIITHVLEEDNRYGFSAKFFSDCVCLSCDYSIEAINYMLFKLSYIQFYFSASGIFLRGSLTYDLHYESKNIIFSQGLVNAYLEEQKAIYPRITIDNKIISLLKSNNIQNNNDSFKYLIKSPDNKYFLDYLDFLYLDGLDKIEQMKGHKQSILEQINENINNSYILDKYKWLSEYHNFKLIEFFSVLKLIQEEFDFRYRDTYIDINIYFPKFSKLL